MLISKLTIEENTMIFILGENFFTHFAHDVIQSLKTHGSIMVQEELNLKSQKAKLNIFGLEIGLLK